MFNDFSSVSCQSELRENGWSGYSTKHKNQKMILTWFNRVKGSELWKSYYSVTDVRPILSDTE